MNKIFLFILILMFSTVSAAPETPAPKKKYEKKKAGYASREATVLSMMGWGIGIFAGIAILCALIDNDPDSTSTTPTN